jgi:hypothetical protein
MEILQKIVIQTVIQINKRFFNSQFFSKFKKNFTNLKIKENR